MSKPCSFWVLTPATYRQARAGHEGKTLLTEPQFFAPSEIDKLTLPASIQSFMGIDFGKKRVGVAVGNRLTGQATPCKSIHATGDARLAEIGLRIKEWQPQALIIGIPYHPDGEAHANTRAATAFGKQMNMRFGLPVYGVDERYSTTEALSLGAADADAASACIILEQFLSAIGR